MSYALQTHSHHAFQPVIQAMPNGASYLPSSSSLVSMPVASATPHALRPLYKAITPVALLAESAKLWAAQLLVSACLQLESLPERDALLAYVCFALPAQNVKLISPESPAETQNNNLLGGLAAWRPEAVTTLLEALITEGYLSETLINHDTKPETMVLTPTAKGFALAKGFYLSHEEPNKASELNAAAEVLPATEQKEEEAPPAAKPPLQPTPRFTNPEEQALYDALRAYRWQLAQQAQIRAYRVCSNAVLEAIVKEKPRTLPALQALHGVGEKFANHYGEGFIAQLHLYGFKSVRL